MADPGPLHVSRLVFLPLFDVGERRDAMVVCALTFLPLPSSRIFLLVGWGTGVLIAF